MALEQLSNVAEEVFSDLPDNTRFIRLIYLEPAQDLDAPIICSLRCFMIEDHPPYEALSWCWGDASLSEEIQLQQHAWRAPANLALALRYLRYTNEVRLLWIDALAIKQGHQPTALNERAEQVKLMETIYTRAAKVVVWMGVPSLPLSIFLSKYFLEGGLLAEDLRDTPETTIPLFMELLRCDWWTRLWVLQEVTLCPEAEIHTGEVIIPFGKVLKELIHFNHMQRDKARSNITHPLQRQLEALLAEVMSIYVGLQNERLHASIMRTELDGDLQSDRSDNVNVLARLQSQSRSQLAHLLQRKFETFKAKVGSTSYRLKSGKSHRAGAQGCVESDLKALSTGMTASTANSGIHRFAQLVVRCRYQETTDQHDKLYGLLGLASSNLRAVLSPSYDEDTSVTYTRTAGMVISKTQSLYLLSQAQKPIDCAKMLSLPSWVPDWSVPAVFRDDWSHAPARDDREKVFCAGSKRPTPTILFDGVDSLIIRGVMIDKVATRGSPLSCGFKDLQQLRRSLQDWGRQAESSKGPLAGLTHIVGQGRRRRPLKKTSQSDFEDVEFDATVSSPHARFWRIIMQDMLSIRMRELRREGLASNVRISTLDETPIHLFSERFDRSPSLIWTELGTRSVVNVTIKDESSKETRETGTLENGRLVLLDCKSLGLCVGDLQAAWEEWRDSFEAEICQHVKKVTRNQVFFSTADGMIGMGPRTMQEGDEVWILSRGTHAYILRNKSPSPPVYTLVGEAYVSNIMYGEIFDYPSMAYRYRHPNAWLANPDLPVKEWPWEQIRLQ